MENNTRATRSEAEEFNAFNATSSASANETKRPPQKKKPAAKKKGGINKNLIIAIVVGVLALALIGGIVFVAMTRDRHILKEDNAYLVYTDSEGDYHLLSNGYEIEKEFEGEVTLEIAADNSFAYVMDNGTDGVYIYVLEGKKLEPLTSSAVTEVLSFASLKPGVVYLDGEKYRLYSEKFGEETITKDATAANFILSADASTVAYTTAKEDVKSERELIVYQDGSSTTLNSKQNCTPVAVSAYGDYIYATFASGDTNKLCVFTTDDLDDPQGEPITDSDGFFGILSMNIKGDELLFLSSVVTADGQKTSTKLYRHAKDEQVAVNVMNGIMNPDPKLNDPNIVYFDDFSDIYLAAYKPDDSSARAVYYMDKKYTATKVAAYTIAEGASDTCVIDPDQNYLYYINEDSELIQLNLKDDNYATKEIDEDVVEFHVTQKGNLYFLDLDGKLRFREASQKKNVSISEDVTDISFYRYSNTLFFTKEEAVNIFSTKEGSDEETVKMDGIQVTALPEFYNAEAKRSYAAYYDVDNGGILFYTSNGKSFEKVSDDCQTINGDDLSDNIS